jgi:hypothetical protein
MSLAVTPWRTGALRELSRDRRQAFDLSLRIGRELERDLFCHAASSST